MKKIPTTTTELLALSDSALNRMVSIKGTDYNRNVKYGEQTKKNWRRLYTADGAGRMTIKEIAEAYGASVNTVRRAVDPDYARKVKRDNVRYNRDYYELHGSRIYDPEYRAELISRKREIISSEHLAHLKSF